MLLFYHLFPHFTVFLTCSVLYLFSVFFLPVFYVYRFQWPGFFWLWLVSCSHAASIALTALFGSGSKVRPPQGLHALRGQHASPWAEWGSPGLAGHPWEGPPEGWRVRFKHWACGRRGWQNALALDTHVFVCVCVCMNQSCFFFFFFCSLQLHKMFYTSSCHCKPELLLHLAKCSCLCCMVERVGNNLQ